MQGMKRQRNAINQPALDGNVRRMGGGDFDQGTRIKAAMDIWQAALAEPGAGPMVKLENVRLNRDAETGLTPALWRQLVEEGWPGADAAFEAVLEAGASLMQLATR